MTGSKRISIFGRGCVGCVTGACFADMGHHVFGVEPNEDKIRLINDGKSPIVEQGLDALIAKVTEKRLFEATSDWRHALEESQIALVCVGTPSRPNGSIDLGYVKRVCQQIGEGLANRTGERLTVVIRRTV